MRGVIAGVDGGGSGCRVVIVDAEGRLVGKGQGGPANVTSDLDGTVASVRAAFAEAGCDDTGMKDVTAHLGLAGVLDAADGRAVLSALRFGQARVTDDRATQLRGALGVSKGALVCLGTGTIIGVQRRAQPRFVGGWGLALSDQASAAWLGRAALAHIVEIQDGLAPESTLSHVILARFPDLRHIIRFASTATPDAFGRLAPDVTKCARDGDPAARRLMQDGADYICRALAAAGHRPGDPICLTGGVGPCYAPYLPQAMCATQIPPAGTALDGALALARDLAAGQP